MHPLPRTDLMLWAKHNCTARKYCLANAAHVKYSDRLLWRAIAALLGIHGLAHALRARIDGVLHVLRAPKLLGQRIEHGFRGWRSGIRTLV